MTFASPLLPRRRLLAAAVVLLLVLLGASASAAHADPGYVYLNQSSYVAHENQGELAITIERTNTSDDEQIRYGVHRADAVPGYDFDTVPNTYVDMKPGVASYTFYVKIFDHGINASPVHAVAYLFGSDPLALGTVSGPSHHGQGAVSQITILRDDPLQVRNPLDILGFDPASTSSVPAAAPLDPLAGVQYWVAGRLSNAGLAARAARRRHPREAGELTFLADQPGVHRFYFWNTPAWPEHMVASYLESTEQNHPNTVMQLSTYSLVHGDCGESTSSPRFIARYERWIQGLAAGIGNYHVVMYLELDSLITAGCLEHYPNRLHARLLELREAIQTLEALPHTAVYIDGGAADAAPWRKDAWLLDHAGVHQAQGFFLNSTHFDWTTTEVRYGQRIARALGGVHFIVNTAENGQGPLVPYSRVKYGNEELCNPAGRGLGPESVQTGFTYVDGFMWFTNPGGSGGNALGCGKGAPPVAKFWAAYAAGLVHRANFSVSGPREPLLRDGPYVPLDPAVAPQHSHAAVSHYNRAAPDYNLVR